ncbi:MAG: amino acid ABC transporter substrate-binding protein [Gammaproteobacteria bacterium]|nr:amino acid ABC transporter substrate-binding protein [Gammaproteobacteria bacterium]
MRILLIVLSSLIAMPLFAEPEDELKSLSIKELMNIPLERDRGSMVITQPDNNKMATDTIHFAILAPISSFPVYSGEIIAAADVATEWINRHGGIRGKRLVVLRADDEENTPVSARLAHTLITDYDVQALVGPATSNSVEDVLKKVAIPKKIPLITQAASAVELAHLSKQQLFWRMVANNEQQVTFIHQFLTEQMNHRKLYVVAGRDLYSQELLAGLENKMTGVAGGVIEHLSLSHLVYLEGMNLQEEVNRIQDSGATAIVITLPTAQMNAMLKKIRTHWRGDLPLILAADTVKPKYIRDAELGTIAQCIYTYVASPADLNPTLRDSIKALLNRDSAGFDAAYVHDAVVLLAMANTLVAEFNIDYKDAMQALTGTGQTISHKDYQNISALYKKHGQLQYSGFSGRIQFNEFGENLAAQLKIYSIADSSQKPLPCNKPMVNSGP